MIWQYQREIHTYCIFGSTPNVLVTPSLKTPRSPHVPKVLQNLCVEHKIPGPRCCTLPLCTVWVCLVVLPLTFLSHSLAPFPSLPSPPSLTHSLAPSLPPSLLPPIASLIQVLSLCCVPTDRTAHRRQVAVASSNSTRTETVSHYFLQS